MIGLNGHGRVVDFPSRGSKMTAGAMALMDTNDTAKLLGRLDERTEHTQVALQVLDAKIDRHDERLSRVESSIESLGPIKSLFYKGIGVILIAILTAVLGLILTRQYAVKDIIQQLPTVSQPSR